MAPYRSTNTEKKVELAAKEYSEGYEAKIRRTTTKFQRRMTDYNRNIRRAKYWEPKDDWTSNDDESQPGRQSQAKKGPSGKNPNVIRAVDTLPHTPLGIRIQFQTASDLQTTLSPILKGTTEFKPPNPPSTAAQEKTVLNLIFAKGSDDKQAMAISSPKIPSVIVKPTTNNSKSNLKPSTSASKPIFIQPRHHSEKPSIHRISHKSIISPKHTYTEKHNQQNISSLNQPTTKSTHTASKQYHTTKTNIIRTSSIQAPSKYLRKPVKASTTHTQTTTNPDYHASKVRTKAAMKRFLEDDPVMVIDDSADEANTRTETQEVTTTEEVADGHVHIQQVETVNLVPSAVVSGWINNTPRHNINIPDTEKSSAVMEQGDMSDTLSIDGGILEMEGITGNSRMVRHEEPPITSRTPDPDSNTLQTNNHSNTLPAPLPIGPIITEGPTDQQETSQATAMEIPTGHSTPNQTSYPPVQINAPTYPPQLRPLVVAEAKFHTPGTYYRHVRRYKNKRYRISITKEGIVTVIRVGSKGGV